MSIKDIDIIKIVVCNEVFFGEKDLNISLVTKMLNNWSFMCISPKNQCM